jgi:hypothetical protein
VLTLHCIEIYRRAKISSNREGALAIFWVGSGVPSVIRVLKTATNSHGKKQIEMKGTKDEKPGIRNREAGIASVINDFGNPLCVHP